ncbi:Methyltransferase domain-containing protein [Marinospirillum alkaliphilum DSM 21637]|uniref:Methyltransferase domain-containing protein n=1 Tax=Marinospirillum alkaliphilum DSM 21637 TaxID=1122209 RepID=A0A1K1UY17_9GAMM|nr:Methyltransferase domain-containing protein [Marinospirillum alkaliphilum DSM 21637]
MLCLAAGFNVQVSLLSSLSVCPLCDSAQTSLWHTETRKPLIGREYHRCQVCDLVFVPRCFHLDASSERAVYQQHENNPADAGYRRFLGRMAEPMQNLLQASGKTPSELSGLDFGCGPGPTLSLMFAEAGYACSNYDLHFAHHPALLQQQYDFITSTEVFEHLAQPAQVLDQLLLCLKPGGLLGSMTQRPRDRAAFVQWHYLMDPTHISFFSETCFDWLAEHWQLQQAYLSGDVIILQRPADC